MQNYSNNVEFTKKVDKVNSGNYINSLTISKVKPFLDLNCPNWQNFKKEIVEYGEYLKKKIKKTVKTPIDCLFYNNLRLYKD